MVSKECTAVMYHYVRNMHNTEYPEIKGLLINKFKRQVNYLSKNYSIIRLEDYIEFLNGKKDIPKTSAILSFDDGFKDHYTNVFPILKEKNLPACFFPITKPLEEKIVPAVHKIHFLLAKIGAKVFADDLNYILTNQFPEFVENYFVDDIVKKEGNYRWDDVLTSNLKWNVSIMPSKPKNEILNQIFNKYFNDEKEFCKELYMSWDEMREMTEGGMSFGGHTHNHPFITTINEDEQKYELSKSKEILEKNLNVGICMFSYPYGRFDEKITELFKKLGYSCALTTEVAVNKGKVDPFKIARLDTNDLPS